MVLSECLTLACGILVEELLAEPDVLQGGFDVFCRHGALGWRQQVKVTVVIFTRHQVGIGFYAIALGHGG